MVLGEIIAVILFMIGCFCIMSDRDIIKTTIGIDIMAGGVILYFLTTPHDHLLPPIGDKVGSVADPLPQALMITNIIIGVTGIAIALAIFIRLYKKYDIARWDIALQKSKGDI